MSTPTLSAPVVQRITVQDAYMARQWGFTDWQWSNLTDSDRADYRSRIVYAPGFSAEGK